MKSFLPPIIKENYGKWKYHEILKPGVLVHVAESGDKLFTVRVGTPRLLCIDSIRKFADLADKYCDGYLRWTSRNNVEFLLTDETKIDPPDQGRRGLRLPRGRHRPRASPTSFTPRAGSTATPRRPTPRASSRR